MRRISLVAGLSGLSWCSILLTQSIGRGIAGAKLASSGKLWRMAPDSIDATVQVDKKREVQVGEQSLGALPEVVSVRPFSVNIYSYPLQ